jgi:hypothetical protein
MSSARLPMRPRVFSTAPPSAVSAGGRYAFFTGHLLIGLTAAPAGAASG